MGIAVSILNIIVASFGIVNGSLNLLNTGSSFLPAP